jgi:hypothetical protein
MILLKGRVDKEGVKDFTRRMREYPDVFYKATGERLIQGTLNIAVDRQIPPKEHFKIRGTEINEPEDFLFEICRINGIWAYRIRPFNPRDGSGGHGDHILEISCSQHLPNKPGTEVEISLFRDNL